jgi:hypothetical protein
MLEHLASATATDWVELLVLRTEVFGWSTDINTLCCPSSTSMPSRIGNLLGTLAVPENSDFLTLVY